MIDLEGLPFYQLIGGQTCELLQPVMLLGLALGRARYQSSCWLVGWT